MIRRVAAAALLALAAAACEPGPTAPSGATGSHGDPRPSLEPPITFGPPPSPTPPDETSPVVLDPTVLAFLPEAVGGVDVTESAEEAAQGISSPDVDKIASAMDAGVAVDIANGNLVYAWVVRLRPDKFSDEIYRQWRGSYDEGACSGASGGGGIIGPAEATIDGRTVYIATCTQGLRTYHVWLEEQGILISASAIGEASFGEQLMDNLRVPS